MVADEVCRMPIATSYNYYFVYEQEFYFLSFVQ
jgi:hypothetical protein